MMSFDPNLVIFYVRCVEKSTAFYSDLLDTQPLHREATFSMLLLKSGLRLGLWADAFAEPKPNALGGGAEIAILVADDQTIDTLFVNHQTKGYAILQPPTQMDFGYTFVIADPDNHRIRYFSKANVE